MFSRWGRSLCTLGLEIKSILMKGKSLRVGRKGSQCKILNEHHTQVPVQALETNLFGLLPSQVNVHITMYLLTARNACRAATKILQFCLYLAIYSAVPHV